MGDPMLVKLPEKGYKDTGEGGLAFFLVVKQRPRGKQRQICIAGDILWPLQDCQIKPCNWPSYLNKPRDFTRLTYETIDAGLLIGSTGLSLWSEIKEDYFTPKVKDLTPEGKRLYHTFKRLYGEVIIITLLDT